MAPVVRFVSLSTLNVSNNPFVKDLLPLSEVKTLRELLGKNTGIQSLSELKDNKDLLRIDVEGSPIGGIQELVALPKLIYLNVNSSMIDEELIPEFLLQRPDLQLIYRSASLSQWWVSLSEEWKQVFLEKMGQTESLGDEELHALTARAELSLERVSLTNLEPLLVFSNLRKLSIFDAPLFALGPLSQLTTLTYLRLSQIPAVDYLPLSALTSLTELDLSNTGLEEVTPLVRLVQLKKINLAGSNISSLKGMETLVNLEELDVASTDLRSLKALEELGRLKKLTCFNTRLTPRAVASFKDKMPGCDVRFY